MKRAKVIAIRCMYCREIIKSMEYHHRGGVEFINGYPSLCRMNRKSNFMFDAEKLPWQYAEVTTK